MSKHVWTICHVTYEVETSGVFHTVIDGERKRRENIHLMVACELIRLSRELQSLKDPGATRPGASAEGAANNDTPETQREARER